MACNQTEQNTQVIAVQTLQYTTQLLNSYNTTVCLHTCYSTKHNFTYLSQ